MSSSKNQKKVLIVGAGPTGLTSAFELARQGIVPQVIDAKKEISPLSRAVGVSASTLELLEESGVTPRLLAEGVKITNAQITLESEKCTALDFSLLPCQYNFLLSLPQDRTEQIMQKRFEELGGSVQYSTVLISLTQKKDGTVEVVTEKDGKRLTETFNAVIGADGVNSKVRQQMGVKTRDYEYPNAWSTAEFNSKDWPSPPGEIQYFLKKNGNFAVVIPLGNSRYRAVSNTSDALACVSGKYTIDKLHSANTFKIVVRHVKTYQKGNIFLAGDAAHTYLPAGGQGGMNLGIKDACSLARRIAENDVKGYTRERRPVGKATIRDSERVVRMAEIKNRFMKAARNKTIHTAMRIKMIRKKILKKSIGL